MKNNQSKNVTLSILILYILVNISIILDIHTLRFVFGLMFYSTIPGFLIINILNLNNIDRSEKFVLSWGMSISFLIFSGIVINYIYPEFGYNTPLSSVSVNVSINTIILILIYIASLRDNSTTSIQLSNISLDVRDKLVLVLPALFPFLSILGIYVMNAKGNNIILIMLYMMIGIYLIIISLNYNKIHEHTYIPMIFLISFSLVLLSGLRSNHIIGADIHQEYYIYQQTLLNGLWHMIFKGSLDACLSISILPTLYQSFLGIDSEYTFKILYPVLVSILPLLIYILAKNYLSANYAFLASIFIMSQSNFLMVATGPRSRLAILFFALSLMVLFSNNLSGFDKRLLFIVFTTSCIFSHYSTAYILLFVLLGMWIGTQIIIHGIQRVHNSDDTHSLPNLNTHLTAGLILLVFVVIFLWYSQVTETAFVLGTQFIHNSLISLQDLFIFEAREEHVRGYFGEDLNSKPILKKIHFIFSWLSFIFIAIGILTILSRARSKTIIAANNRYLRQIRVQSAKISKQRSMDVEFFTLSFTCALIMVLSITLPFVLKGYDMARIAFQMMTALSVFFIIGGITVAELLYFRKKCYLIILTILIPIFLFNTGAIYEIFGDSNSILLNNNSNDYDIYYVHDQEAFAAKWLKEFSDNSIKIYTDNFGERRLMSQGLIKVPIYSNSIIEYSSVETGYIYIRYSGVVDSKLLDKSGQWHNITDYQEDLFSGRNLIYSNNGSEIWLLADLCG